MKEAGAVLGSVPCKGASHVMLMKPAASVDIGCGSAVEPRTANQFPFCSQRGHGDKATSGSNDNLYLDIEPPQSRQGDSRVHLLMRGRRNTTRFPKRENPTGARLSNGTAPPQRGLAKNPGRSTRSP